MVQFMMANGKMIKKMEQANFHIQMEIQMMI